ncbi:metalloendopeptidase [Plakobranchus ocellatus]|uniref:Metalloendopeptidase n=1 Tax=Plakobranchus ocellatus TaxID=259542 RepID=A0AAV4DMV4_9GAST|nr:metalloendopeptidase [Plakobranchus ocellatus]
MFLRLTLVVNLFQLKEGTVVTVYPEDPYSDVISDPGFVPEPEVYTNQTIDQAILSNYDGLQGYMSDHFFNDDGTITAELDIRMSMEMFQDMYGQYFATAPEPVRRKRKATRPTRLRWTNGIVPYEFISSHFTLRLGANRHCQVTSFVRGFFYFLSPISLSENSDTTTKKTIIFHSWRGFSIAYLGRRNIIFQPQVRLKCTRSKLPCRSGWTQPVSSSDLHAQAIATGFDSKMEQGM